MKHFLLLFALLAATACVAQPKNIAGIYSNTVPGLDCEVTITLREDSTFDYFATIHPVFETLGRYYEYGKWTIAGDTLILNPQLTPKLATQTAFQEEENTSDTGLTLTFNLVTRYFDSIRAQAKKVLDKKRACVDCRQTMGPCDTLY
jgi:hypothetical protein